jgi:hypothetical protein
MPPVTLPEDVQIIKTLYGHAEPESVLDARGDETIKSLCAKYSVFQKAEKEAKDQKDAAIAELLMKIGTAEKVLVDGYSISAGVIGETVVEQYTRKAYRNCRIYVKKDKQEKAA